MYSITSSNSKSITVRVVEVSRSSGAPVVARIPIKDDEDGWPGRLRVVTFKVEDYVLAALDRLAEQLKTPRSELIRLGIAVILAIFSDGGEARRLLEQLRELEEKVDSIEEDVEWLKGVLHDHIGPI